MHTTSLSNLSNLMVTLHSLSLDMSPFLCSAVLKRGNHCVFLVVKLLKPARSPVSESMCSPVFHNT